LKIKKLIKSLISSEIYDPKLKLLNEEYGHQLSKVTKNAVNKNGEAIPWFTYPAIEFLCQLNFSNSSVFEWGSGNSSKYFSARCNSIISIEHNLDWFKAQEGTTNKNQEIIYAKEDEYASKITAFNRQFDIIIIDGILRDECLTIALNYLKSDGMFIYDNSDRDYQNCLKLRDAGFIQIDFSGFGPINDYTWTTSIFFKQFKFKPNNIQPFIPIGGGF
jgi:hypothetical protein